MERFFAECAQARQSEKKRSRRTRIKIGAPLTVTGYRGQAEDRKRSLIVIRNKYNIASAIITAIQRIRFYLNLPSGYQQCRYVPIILIETFKTWRIFTFQKKSCTRDFMFLLSFTEKYRDRFKNMRATSRFYLSLYYILL